MSVISKSLSGIAMLAFTVASFGLSVPKCPHFPVVQAANVGKVKRQHHKWLAIGRLPNNPQLRLMVGNIKADNKADALTDANNMLKQVNGNWQRVAMPIITGVYYVCTYTPFSKKLNRRHPYVAVAITVHH